MGKFWLNRMNSKIDFLKILIMLLIEKKLKNV